MDLRVCPPSTITHKQNAGRCPSSRTHFQIEISGRRIPTNPNSAIHNPNYNESTHCHTILATFSFWGGGDRSPSFLLLPTPFNIGLDFTRRPPFPCFELSSGFAASDWYFARPSSRRKKYAWFRKYYSSFSPCIRDFYLAKCES